MGRSRGTKKKKEQKVPPSKEVKSVEEDESKLGPGSNSSTTTASGATAATTERCTRATVGMGGKSKSAGGEQGGQAQPTSTSKLLRSKKESMDEDGEATNNEDNGKVSGGGSEEQSDFCKNESNPLLNDVILGNLFKFLSPETLATCRLVCKKWKTESLTAWRSTSILTLAPFKEKRDKIHVGGKVTTVNKLLSYLELERECKDKPYRRLQLCDWKFRRTDGPDEDGHAKLWNILRQNLTELNIKGYFFADAVQFCKIVFQSCPNLETLRLDYNAQRAVCGRGVFWREETSPSEYIPPMFGEQVKLKKLSLHSGNGFYNILPVTWLELLSHFPSLTSLTMSSRITYSNVFFEILKAIKVIRTNDNRKLPLKMFNIGKMMLQQDEESEKGSYRMRELQLPLQSLCISFWGSTTHLNVGADGIQALMEQNKSSLTSIRFQFSPDGRHLARLFPFGMQLLNLRELTFESDDFISSLEFMKDTPQLQELCIFCPYQRCSEEWEYRLRTTLISNIPDDHLVGFAMSDLTTLWMEYVVSDDDIKRLRNWMPHVSHLRIVLNDNQFLIVCNNWKKLEELYVLGKELTDEGVTGRRLNVATKNLSRAKGVAKNRNKPNVTILGNLKKFGSMSPMLTDASVLYGLVGLPNLQEVALTNSQIGTEGVKALTDKNVRYHSHPKFFPSN